MSELAADPVAADPVAAAKAEHVARLSETSMTPPSANQGLLEVFRRRYVLRLLVRREISARYQSSVLGLMWSYVNPLTQFFIYYFVMGVLFGRAQRTPEFAIHVFTGLIVVHFFTETLNAGTRSMTRNKSLVQKMAVPREMFPVASMLVSLFHVGPQVVILLIATVAAGWRPDAVGLVYGVAAIVISMALGTALALVFSAANVFLRDTSNAVNVLSNFVRFGSPMMYPYSLVAQRFGGHNNAYLLNPISDAVLAFQRAFWVGATPDPEQIIKIDMPTNMAAHVGYAIVISLVLLGFAQLIFVRLEKRIPERL